MRFRNDDYVGKVNCGFNEQIVTKPHNMYLQIWVQDGLPTLFAFLALYLSLLAEPSVNVSKKENGIIVRKFLLALLCGVSGYFVAGLANDSSICVAPVFWVLFGVAFAVSRRE